MQALGRDGAASRRAYVRLGGHHALKIGDGGCEQNGIPAVIRRTATHFALQCPQLGRNAFERKGLTAAGRYRHLDPFPAKAVAFSFVLWRIYTPSNRVW